ncbi:AlpA family transcriptional regulator [Ruegeria sp. HKCCA4008]|uniref:helix-turn-helix transcriptional regulator n=1 Tax=Ruegeria sp. HKCCA4008 TaxID=2682999 RepID=UPI001487B650|nr:AlpA family transcriptional regulator [Ruegeria sp. HKCCA4008]
MQNKLIRRPEVETLTGLSRSTIYEWINSGRFPKPLQLGPRTVAWREADILEWIESRPVAGKVLQ